MRRPQHCARISRSRHAARIARRSGPRTGGRAQPIRPHGGEPRSAPLDRRLLPCRRRLRSRPRNHHWGRRFKRAVCGHDGAVAARGRSGDPGPRLRPLHPGRRIEPRPCGPRPAPGRRWQHERARVGGRRRHPNSFGHPQQPPQPHGARHNVRHARCIGRRVGRHRRLAFE